MNRIARIVICGAALAALVAGCGKSRTPETAAPALTTAPAIVPGRMTAEIRVSAAQVAPNESYRVTYAVHNGMDSPITVKRIDTNHGPIAPGTPGWTQAQIDPGQTTNVAQVTFNAAAAGTDKLTATFITDRGACDATPVSVAVTAAAGPAMSGRVKAGLTASSTQVLPGQPVTLTYDLTDSTANEIRVLSIDIDSSSPLTSANPGWIENRVPSGGRRTIARRTVTKTEPGTYPLRARFNTDRGSFTAEALTLVVESPTPVDTGHVTARIDISPNPCPLGSNYSISYQIVNTTLKDVTVSGINTDLGPLGPDRAEWRNGTAEAGRTTTIAEIDGSGDVTTSRNKTANFTTSAGSVGAPSVLLIVQ